MRPLTELMLTILPGGCVRPGCAQARQKGLGHVEDAHHVGFQVLPHDGGRQLRERAGAGHARIVHQSDQSLGTRDAGNLRRRCFDLVLLRYVE